MDEETGQLSLLDDVEMPEAKEPVLDREEGLRRMRVGKQRAWDHAPPDLKEQVLELVRQLAERQEEITSDDINQAAHDAGVEIPVGWPAMGSILPTAARNGWIVSTSRVLRSAKPSNHGRHLIVWKSRLYRAQK